MAKHYSATKHIYTLNDDKISSSAEESDSDSGDDEIQLDFQDVQKENKRLTKKNQQLQRRLNELQLKNQQLFQLSQLAERRNLKHEQKQRDLIKKLSYFQVANKQLASDARKVQQDMVEQRQYKRVSEGHANELKQLIRKTQSDKDKFLGFVRQLLQMLKRCDKAEQFQLEKDKIIQYLSRNISSVEASQKLTYEFDFKFELSRVDTLREKIKSLEKQLEESEQSKQKERTRLASSYHQKIGKLKNNLEDLKEQIHNQQEEHRRKLKMIVAEKNQIIDNLKAKLKENTRKSSMDIRRSREQKNFIGDGQYSHLELTELNEAIQTLQQQIIKEFEE